MKFLDALIGVSSSQAREIREAGLKVAALERSLGQALRDADAERQVLLQRTAAQLAQAEGEGNSLRRLVRLGEVTSSSPGSVILANVNQARQIKGGLRKPA